MNIAEAIAATKSARESHPVEAVDIDTHQDASPAAGTHVAAFVAHEWPSGAPQEKLPITREPRPLDGVTSADEFLRGSPLDFAYSVAEYAPRPVLSVALVIDSTGIGYPP